MQRAFSRLSLTALTIVLANCSSNNILNNYDLESAFVEVNAVLPDSTPIIETEIRYFTNNNFVGEPIAGYNANKAMLTIEAAQALSEVQTDLAKSGMGLKIFDAYRPQRAVDHFVRWAMDIEDKSSQILCLASIHQSY
jgi:D-alanyl-D-alanine dipeptidase